MIHDVNVKLLGVNFKTLNVPEKESIQIQVSDKIDDINICNDDVTIKCSRLVECVPESLFKIDVDYQVSFVKDKKQSNEKLIKDIKENPNDYLISALSMVSFIVSNLTSCVGNYPLITTPVFENEKS